MNTKTRQGTRAVWAGEEEYLLGATQVPVVLSAAFGHKDLEEWFEVARGKAEGHIYTRNSNPTIHVFEEKVRLLEDAEAATSAASGMGIISSTLFALLASGNRVVSVKDTYGGTSAIFNDYMPKYRIDAVQCDTADHDLNSTSKVLTTSVV
jgi:cystathionine gamma-synthase